VHKIKNRVICIFNKYVKTQGSLRCISMKLQSSHHMNRKGFRKYESKNVDQVAIKLTYNRIKTESSSFWIAKLN
jgi:hypothetical protein